MAVINDKNELVFRYNGEESFRFCRIFLFERKITINNYFPTSCALYRIRVFNCSWKQKICMYMKEREKKKKMMMMICHNRNIKGLV